jgi:hypothetical protein
LAAKLPKKFMKRIQNPSLAWHADKQSKTEFCRPPLAPKWRSRQRRKTPNMPADKKPAIPARLQTFSFLPRLNGKKLPAPFLGF